MCLEDTLVVPANHSSVLVKYKHDLREPQRLQQDAKKLGPKEMAVQNVNSMRRNVISKVPQRTDRQSPWRWIDMNVGIVDRYLARRRAQRNEMQVGITA